MFEKYLEGFKGYLEMRNFSNDTVQGYGKNIKMFFSFIKENYPRVEKIEQLSRTIIEDYHSYITVFKTKKNKPYATKTKFVKIASLKSFFKYLLIKDYIVSNPTANLEYPKRERTLPRDVPTIKEVQRMLNYPDLSTPNGLRNKAILELVYACGMRTCELSNLKIKDVNLKEQMAIIINGKGGNLTVDGGLGPGTSFGLAKYKPSIDRVRCYRLKHYYDLVNKRPEQERFLYGWYKRAISI